ncbi:Succinyl-diaminopimelate desuccinylase [Labeo rohita]|uniref:Succinyl-diaminopimelate desuccinylase n=1 Tax=Labeo rohita TaxID=84645 RepID=A0ABQ8LAX5_LABRO|nr:Succinyl-diaminopimelate desuccinylase [Labeo rohita]
MPGPCPTHYLERSQHFRRPGQLLSVMEHSGRGRLSPNQDLPKKKKKKKKMWMRSVRPTRPEAYLAASLTDIFKSYRLGYTYYLPVCAWNQCQLEFQSQALVGCRACLSASPKMVITLLSSVGFLTRTLDTFSITWHFWTWRSSAEELAAKSQHKVWLLY